MSQSNMAEFVGPARTILHTLLWASEMLDEPDLVKGETKRAEYEVIIANAISALSDLYDRQIPRMRLAS